METGNLNPFFINFNDEDENSSEVKIFQVGNEISGNENIENKEEEVDITEEIPEEKNSSDFFEPEKDVSNSLEKESFSEEDDKGPIKEAVYLIEVDKIRPNSQQPRRYFHPESLKELANSIREYGILQPLTLVRAEKETDSGSIVEYELIAGERRWRASQMLGLARVPAIIREPMAEKQKLEVAIIENVQRQDLDPIETARAYSKLADEFNLTQREIALRIGVSREAVANALRLLQLPTEAQRALIAGKISESHARVILIVDNPEKQRALLGEILDKHLTVREADALARRATLIPSSENTQTSTDLESVAWEKAIKEKLEQMLGTKVEVRKKGEHGKITINFFSEEELGEILRKISGD